MSKIKLNLLTILDGIEKIKQYSNSFSNADDFYHSQINFDATMMQFIIIGEAVERLDEKFKESHKIESSWKSVKNFRNLIAHNYFGIDAEEVWEIINKQIIILKNDISTLLSQLKN